MAKTRDFLLEIGTEELPSAPLDHCIAQLGKLIAKGLDEAGLAHGEVRIISSPRRLAALVADVAEATEATHEVMRGPAAAIAFDDSGAPTKAAQGFARGKGVPVESLTVREEGGREYVFAEVDTAAKEAQPLLQTLSESVIGELDWPRSQRWGSTHERFGRPVRWLVCLFGEEPLQISYADVVSGTTTRGHRVLNPGPHEVPSPDRYLDVLHDAYVLDQPERQERIRAGIAKIEEERGVHVDTPVKVFDEVVNLCEWPDVLVGNFDEEFLQVPHEIICESMLSNQRYFPIYDGDGALTRAFVVVSNGDPANGATIIDGNERVVRARLDDAKFFFEEDLKVPLDDFLPRLGKVTFQEKLGTMAQKVARLEVLAPQVAELAGATADQVAQAQRAAHLAKADLVSQAVVEFTSQQGVMGGYYAEAAGEDAEVARAIREHYRPRFAGDAVPTDVVGMAVAVADKLDTICGMFAIEEPPTGSSDPFAQRRSAIGILNMVRDVDGFDLAAAVDASLDSYREQGLPFDLEKTRSEIVDFILGRLSQMLKDEGVAPDVISAVKAAGVIDPAQIIHRVEALSHARSDEPALFDDLATAYARASHLGDPALGVEVDTTALSGPEAELLAAVENGQKAKEAALAAGDFEGALAALAALRGPIDRFFDAVMVMDEDPDIRANRIRLLNGFVALFDGVADFGLLVREA